MAFPVTLRRNRRWGWSEGGTLEVCGVWGGGWCCRGAERAGGEAGGLRCRGVCAWARLTGGLERSGRHWERA